LVSVARAGALSLAASGAAGGVGAAAAHDATANESLVVGVEHDDEATVIVTHSDSAVENASVTVDVTAENVTYDGAGEYRTDDDGEVELPAPEENVTVAITAAADGATGATTVTLTAGETDDATGSFGQLVSSFVTDMLDAGGSDGGIGQAVSEFVTANNPGNAENAPADAGRPDDAGQPDDASPDGDDEDSEDDERGPPEHAGPGGDDEDGADDADDETDDADEDETDDDERRADGSDEEDDESDDGDGAPGNGNGAGNNGNGTDN
jgi:hypothetical protein